MQTQKLLTLLATCHANLEIPVFTLHEVNSGAVFTLEFICNSPFLLLFLEFYLLIHLLLYHTEFDLNFYNFSSV